jgi:hypothetical protein
MKYLFAIIAALALVGTASATSSSADCCGGGSCCLIKCPAAQNKRPPRSRFALRGVLLIENEPPSEKSGGGFVFPMRYRSAARASKSQTVSSLSCVKSS